MFEKIHLLKYLVILGVVYRNITQGKGTYETTK